MTAGMRPPTAWLATSSAYLADENCRSPAAQRWLSFEENAAPQPRPGAGGELALPGAGRAASPARRWGCSRPGAGRAAPLRAQQKETERATSEAQARDAEQTEREKAEKQETLANDRATKLQSALATSYFRQGIHEYDAGRPDSGSAPI